MARRFFNKEHHFNTPRLEKMGESTTVVLFLRSIVSYFLSKGVF
jgi:hypothetical protein